jgi:hypothetical protein
MAADLIITEQRYGSYHLRTRNGVRELVIGGMNPDPQFSGNLTNPFNQESWHWANFNGAGWSCSGGAANSTGVANSYFFMTLPFDIVGGERGLGLTPGRTYYYKWDLLTRTAGSVGPYFGSGVALAPAQTVPGHYEGFLTNEVGDGTGEFGFFTPDGFVGTLTNFYIIDAGY